MVDPLRLYTREEVARLTGYSIVHLQRLERDGVFPRAFKFSPTGGKWGGVRYVSSEIDQWMHARAASRIPAGRSARTQTAAPAETEAA